LIDLKSGNGARAFSNPEQEELLIVSGDPVRAARPEWLLMCQKEVADC